ncbi:hypothetical protein HanXRQr2_Chr03g0125371 [Helianthus annuus]|uniref:Uncharacterized protein n=1 Tax=Helianthus annuus TaxID=4232 RepID=A0A9K3JIJ5_HELAN|nr:hypothetical protein HanXRQr2_Chr03g0125371 [Helianthus annuus]KAJ0594072.1 hypothetical protein HanHA300_Chr03g0104411 [Helianthus annuus]KAJ0602156.1 hypothetical protein HanIR_Chr03g0136531 [Helianthus annuus]KAJ0769157.1 hypothetical protein HanLR1_Chr03g0109631 [Helianthus annuus]KAJ0774906.1 hypothetical protein HanOQP8_Chr03g0117061 [Helianthus annuus]
MIIPLKLFLAAEKMNTASTSSGPPAIPLYHNHQQNDTIVQIVSPPVTRRLPWIILIIFHRLLVFDFGDWGGGRVEVDSGDQSKQRCWVVVECSDGACGGELLWEWWCGGG